MYSNVCIVIIVLCVNVIKNFYHFYLILSMTFYLKEVKESAYSWAKLAFETHLRHIVSKLARSLDVVR